jgi:hypothetical protein
VVPDLPPRNRLRRDLPPGDTFAPALAALPGLVKPRCGIEVGRFSTNQWFALVASCIVRGVCCAAFAIFPLERAVPDPLSRSTLPFRTRSAFVAPNPESADQSGRVIRQTFSLQRGSWERSGFSRSS